MRGQDRSTAARKPTAVRQKKRKTTPLAAVLSHWEKKTVLAHLAEKMKASNSGWTGGG